MIARATSVVLFLALLVGLTAGAVPTSTGRSPDEVERSWMPFARDVAATAEADWAGPFVAEPAAVQVAAADEAPPKRTTRTGTASTYGPGWEGWIAWPAGPGWKLRVCGSGGCVVVVTTDAGPDRAMQRAGRILDLDVATFERVTGVSWTVGLAKVSVTVLGKVSVAQRADPES